MLNKHNYNNNQNPDKYLNIVLDFFGDRVYRSSDEHPNYKSCLQCCFSWRHLWIETYGKCQTSADFQLKVPRCWCSKWERYFGFQWNNNGIICNMKNRVNEVIELLFKWKEFHFTYWKSEHCQNSSWWLLELFDLILCWFIKSHKIQQFWNCLFWQCSLFQ